MVEIIPTITASDACDASVNIELHQIIMNEGEETNAYDPDFDEGLGDGNTVDDIQVTDGRIYLRAERSGNNLAGGGNIQSPIGRLTPTATAPWHRAMC